MLEESPLDQIPLVEPPPELLVRGVRDGDPAHVHRPVLEHAVAIAEVLPVVAMQAEQPRVLVPEMVGLVSEAQRGVSAARPPLVRLDVHVVDEAR